MVGRLDRDAVARVLHRAQTIEDRAGSDSDHGVEPAALIEAAEEVGIHPNAVRDSLAIERLSIHPTPPARLDRLAGPDEIVVEREIAMTVGAAVSGIEAWLTTAHRLRCDRRSVSTLHCRRRTDSSAHVGRAVSGVRGEGRLGVVSELTVEAVAQTVGSTPTRPRTIVRIRADRSTPRQLRLAGGGIIGLTGLGAGAGAFVAGSAVGVVPLVSVPLVAGGLLVARTGKGHAARLELELERLISAVERGELPTGLLGKVARSARRAAQSVQS